MTRAAVLRGPRLLEVEQVELPPLAPDWVEVEVAGCAVCATDLAAWRRGTLERPLAGVTGHELAGIVTAAGPAVTSVGVGDRICLEPNLAASCGRCDACARGDGWSCRERTALPVWGFAERIVLRDAGALALPASVPLELGVLAEPLACGVHGLRRSRAAALGGGRIDGRRVLVVGAGAIGLLASLAARQLGAAWVGVVASHEHQRRLAHELVADEVWPASAELEAADIVVVAAGGGSSAFATALKAARPGGELVVLGLFDEPQPVDTRRAAYRNLTLTFAASYGASDGTTDFAVALELLAETAPRLAPLLTHTFSLEEVAGAFATAADSASGAVRVLVRPGEIG